MARWVCAAAGLVAALVLLVARWLEASVLPLPRCTFHWMTGFPCPLCGGTRAFFDAAHGRWAEGFQQSSAGVAAYAATWAVLGVSLMWTVRPPSDSTLQKLTHRTWIIALAAALAASWIYKLAQTA